MFSNNYDQHNTLLDKTEFNNVFESNPRWEINNYLATPLFLVIKQGILASLSDNNDWMIKIQSL